MAEQRLHRSLPRLRAQVVRGAFQEQRDLGVELSNEGVEELPEAEVLVDYPDRAHG
jgi:hypothetical protein